MKKIAAAIVALILATNIASAGNNLPFVKFGFKGGINVEKQHIRLPSDLEGWEKMLNDQSTGYHLGAVLRVNIPLMPLFVQGELLYNWNNIKESGMKVKTSYFSAPVMLGAGIGFGETFRIRANVGPVFNFGSKVKWKGDYKDAGDVLEKPAVTWTAGVGVDIFGFMVDARYNGQFKTQKEKLTIGDMVNNIDAKPSSWSISLGFLF